MAFAGEILENPVSGERITFQKTAKDTGGEVLIIEVEVAPRGHVPNAHRHPNQVERFEVLDGALRFRKGHRTVTARAGDAVVVAPGSVHRFKNAGPGSARARVEVRSALRMEELFETTVALAREGRTTTTGTPRPLDLALFMREFDAEVRAPFVPAGAMRALTAPLAWLARRRGMDKRYHGAGPSAPRSSRDDRRPTSSCRAPRHHAAS
jgi:quercetin dioxygenase-like cupin family protein